jgi:hypothetical protein
MMDELQETVETIIELDEPEALLSTLRRAAKRKKGERWQALAKVLDEAEFQLDQLLNAKPAGPDFRPNAPGAKGNSQPQPTGADPNGQPADAPDAAPKASHASPAAPEAVQPPAAPQVS